MWRVHTKKISICKVLKYIFWQACGEVGIYTEGGSKFGTFLESELAVIIEV